VKEKRKDSACASRIFTVCEELKNDDVPQGNEVYLLSFTDEVSGLVFEYPPITSVEDLQKYIE
jgi:hypothetical protein